VCGERERVCGDGGEAGGNAWKRRHGAEMVAILIQTWRDAVSGGEMGRWGKGRVVSME
jgi:hypothetical protein